MAIVYWVRKKKFKLAGRSTEKYFAVQRKLQNRGGKNIEDLAKILSERKGCTEGDVLNILYDLPQVIEQILKNGESVTIRGLGSFQTAITSDGFDRPDDVLPHTVRLSKVYFLADRKFSYRIGLVKFFRYALSQYFPKSMLRPETIAMERIEDIQTEVSFRG